MYHLKQLNYHLFLITSIVPFIPPRFLFHLDSLTYTQNPFALTGKGVNLTLILLSMTMNRTSLEIEIIWKYLFRLRNLFLSTTFHKVPSIILCFPDCFEGRWHGLRKEICGWMLKHFFRVGH
jgi:hypothetical protein